MFWTDPYDPPPGECVQCWAHAYDKSIHAQLAPDEDCADCLDHLDFDCPEEMIVY
ncbi:pRL2-8 [Streptomyces sp. NPDC018059]|uniref:pRL2-8 n=1 Tax=Streptomyces sp. NPDC018059 TaxID=3365041 RepID=UPI0037BB3FBD